MKRKAKKAKPQIVWMPWEPECGFRPDFVSFAGYRTSWTHLAFVTGDTIGTLRREGWRIVRVKISEV